MSKDTTIILINEIIFSIATLTFFYLGADRVLPIGFIIIVFGVGVFAVLQYFYLKRFIIELINNCKRAFYRNSLRFFILGLSLSIVAIIINTLKINEIGRFVIIFNVLLVTIPIIIYGLWFYVLNVILLKIIKW